MAAKGIGRCISSLQQRQVKTGGRLIEHARYFWLPLAERPTCVLFGSTYEGSRRSHHQQDRRAGDPEQISVLSETGEGKVFEECA